MTRKARFLLLVSLLLTLAAGCARTSRQSVSDSAATADSLAAFRADSLEKEKSLRRTADSLTRSLTLEQRAAMVLMPAVYTRTDAATMALLRSYVHERHTGGVILLRGDTLSARVIADSIARWRGREFFIAIDAEWGLGMRLTDATSYPDNRTIGLNSTPEAVRKYGREVGRQCRRLGINMLLGPVADIVPDSLRDSSYIGRRSFGSDPARVAELVCAYSRGAAEADVLTVVKHFPGHGGVAADSHKTLPSLRKPLRQLTAEDLRPFRRYIDLGGRAVMIGHISVPAVDPQLRSAASSPAVIGDLLRDDMHFSGLILTDALNMGGAADIDPAEAIAAGADMILAPADTPAAIRRITDAVLSGELPEERLNESVTRIFLQLLRQG